ncbi:MAG: hypothetical protein ACHWZW_00455 [Spirulina sp.]
MGLNLVLALGLLGLGIQVYRWQQRHDGWGALGMVVGLGLLSTVAVAIRLITLGPRATPQAMVKVCLTLWGLGFGLMAGLGIGFPLLILSVQLPILMGQPWLFWPWVVVVLPTLVFSLWEWGTASQVARTPANLGWLLALHLAYFVGMNGLILLPLGAFLAVVPLGIGLQLVSGGNVLILWARESDTLPLLCHGIDQRIGAFLGSAIIRHCDWVLWGFHLGHGVILVLGILYGWRSFDWMATRYGQGIRWLRSRLTS